METSHLIRQPDPYDDICAFVTGDDERTPARIAWLLESLALHQGWPAGGFLGSENDLIERFGVSRDAVREAIRIVEARGSMRMRRGRKGGLHLIHPSLDQAAGAFATYLRACGSTDADFTEIKQVAGPILAELGANHIIVRLYERTLTLLAADIATDTDLTGRGPVIAMQLIQRVAPIPEAGVHLGCEAELCTQFNSCRSTFRQALRILDDLGMLRVRRGRNGGYCLQRPAEIGMIRQLFALLATQQQALDGMVPVLLALNLANLQLAMRNLKQMSQSARSERCDMLSSCLNGAAEPYRWALLQHELAQVANQAMVSTLQRSCAAYYGRLAPPMGFFEDTALLAMEKATVEALRECADDEVQRLHRSSQARVAELLYSNDAQKANLPPRMRGRRGLREQLEKRSLVL